MVSITHSNGKVYVLTEDGLFHLPEKAIAIFGADHPQMKEVAQDMVKLCKHPDSGDYVLFGWSKKVSLSFPINHTLFQIINIIGTKI